MKFLIKTKQKEKTLKVLEDFSKEFKAEYKKQLKGLRLRFIRRISPIPIPEELEPIVLNEGDNIALTIPIALPDFKMLRRIIAKFRGSAPEPRWKEKLIRDLNGYLRGKGIEAKIEYAGD